MGWGGGGGRKQQVFLERCDHRALGTPEGGGHERKGEPTAQKGRGKAPHSKLQIQLSQTLETNPFLVGDYTLSLPKGKTVY